MFVCMTSTFTCVVTFKMYRSYAMCAFCVTIVLWIQNKYEIITISSESSRPKFVNEIFTFQICIIYSFIGLLITYFFHGIL